MYMAGMGTIINELPRQGRNLRLYVRLPDGSFGTGHYDACQTNGPCNPATVDAKGFATFEQMSTYAGGRGEALVMVTTQDLTALCGCDPDGVGCVGQPAYPSGWCPTMTVSPSFPVAPPVIIAPGPTDSGPITIVSSGGYRPPVATGVPTPTIITTPGGPVIVPPPETAGPGTEFSEYAPYLALAALAILFLSRRKG